MIKTTPLYKWHESNKGKLVDFAGYSLPIQYDTGIVKEHTAVRTTAGVFDVSHMGELILKGDDALKNVQMVVTNDCSTMKPGQVKYCPMCNKNGGTVDDALVYMKNDKEYLLVVNAANKEKDYNFIKENLSGNVEFIDDSDKIGQIALQGPKSVDIMKKLAGETEVNLPYYTFIEDAVVGGIKCLLSRTGYTGEDGFELYLNAADTTPMWEKLLEAGKEFGIIPCGLGARDTLRLEAGMPLYGHEMTEEIGPLEAGLAFSVKMDKADFVGKSALAKNQRLYKRIGLKITGKGIAREGCDLYVNGEKAGVITSGTQSISCGYPIAMARVKIESLKEENEFLIDVRGKKVEAEPTKMPFYKK